MQKTHHFEKNAKLFWGGGHPLFKLNVTPPKKNPSYGLA